MEKSTQELQLPGSPRKKNLVELSQDTCDTGGLQNRLSQPTMSPLTSRAQCLGPNDAPTRPMNPNRTVAFAPHETFDKALRPSPSCALHLPTAVNCILQALHPLDLSAAIQIQLSQPSNFWLPQSPQLRRSRRVERPPTQNERNQAAPPAPTAHDPLLGQAHHSFKSVTLPGSCHLSLC